MPYLSLAPLCSVLLFAISCSSEDSAAPPARDTERATPPEARPPGSPPVVNEVADKQQPEDHDHAHDHEADGGPIQGEGQGKAGEEQAQEQKDPDEEKKKEEESWEDKFRFVNALGEAIYPAGYGILGRDEATGDLGIAMISHLPASGGVLTDAGADVGVVMLGGSVDTTWRQQTMALLTEGKTAEQAVQQVTQVDTRASRARVLAALDHNGKGTAFIGDAVLGSPRSSYSAKSENCVGVGLMLETDGNPVETMLKNFEESKGLPLPERLLMALDAAEKSLPNGPMLQLYPPLSATLLVVRREGGYDGRLDRLVDLRVDYSKDPLNDLRGYYRVWCDAILIPRLRVLQRGITDIRSKEYQLNTDWLRRMRMRFTIGERAAKKSEGAQVGGEGKDGEKKAKK